MTTAALASTFLDYDLGAQRVASAGPSATLRGLQSAMRSHARATASDLISAGDSMLRGIAQECALPDWDGAGADAVAHGTVDNAERLLRELHSYLPSVVPLPYIVPETDGDLSLTWQAGADRMFSISVDANGGVAFASRLAGGVEFHGKGQLDEMAPVVLQALGATITDLFAAPESSSRGRSGRRDQFIRTI